MEIQAMQTQEFETSKKVAFASVVSVFQDLGYIIDSADIDTGLITANSPSDSKKDWLFTGNTYTSKTRATAFVEPVQQERARIRLNFVAVNHTSSAWGQGSQEDQPILDQEVYRKAFSKIDEAIFVRSANTDMSSN